MNSGRIALGFLIIAVIVASLFFGVAKMPTAYAATNSNGSTTASVTVNGFVSITLYNVPIAFPATDPGTVNTAATLGSGYPMNISVDGTTNDAVLVFMNASNFTSGTNGFLAGAMRFNVTNSSTGTSFPNSSCAASYACNYSLVKYQIFNETARNNIPSNTSVFNWISIPASQTPGTYSNAVKICAMEAGTSGC